MPSNRIFAIALFFAAMAGQAAGSPPIARGEADAAPSKPALSSLLKPRSIERVTEDYDVITNSEWGDNDDFAFVNAVLIRAPLSRARPLIMDFSLYPRISSAIRKFDYDPATQTIEMIGEAYSLHMHSWVRVDQRYWDEIRYEIIRGDMTGFKVTAWLWDRQGKTLAVARGLLPRGRKTLPALVAAIFKPVSEVVLGVATKSFRGYIEEENHKTPKAVPTSH